MEEKTKDEILEEYQDLIRTFQEKITGMELHIFHMERREKLYKSTINTLENQLNELKKSLKSQKVIIKNDY